MILSATPSNRDHGRYSDEHPNLAVTIEHPSDDMVLSEMLDVLERLLSAMGYSIDGQLDIVKDDE